MIFFIGVSLDQIVEDPGAPYLCQRWKVGPDYLPVRQQHVSFCISLLDGSDAQAASPWLTQA